MQFFKYGLKEINYLKDKDGILGSAIERIGFIKREITPDPFQALISSVVSQQISKKAAATVWQRLLERLGIISAETIAPVDLKIIQECGMSLRKAGYIKGIAEAALTGQVDFEKLKFLKDEEVIEILCTLPGVGIWTAEMLLIFSLARPDIVSYKDLAIRRGMMNLYQLNELSPETFEKKRKIYSPFGSVASLYLWACS